MHEGRKEGHKVCGECVSLPHCEQVMEESYKTCRRDGKNVARQ